MPKPEDAPACPGYDGRPGDWIILSQAATILGCSRQNANLMMHAGKFSSLCTAARGKIFLVSEREVEGMRVLRDRDAEAKAV